MSLITGYFDKITFSKIGQFDSKIIKVIFKNQILWNYEPLKVDASPSFFLHSYLILPSYIQFH